MKSIEVFINNKCNYKCNFCFEYELKKYKNYTFKEIIDIINNGYLDGARHIIFSGGEPTLNKNLEDYILYSKKIGYKKIWIHSNGFNLGNKLYFDKMYSSGMTGVVLSIQGIGEIHDMITGYKRSFELINNALIYASKIKKIDKNFSIDTNTVICKTNSKILYKIYLYLIKFPISKRLFSFPNSTEFIKLNNLERYEKMKKFMIKYDDVKIDLKKINNHGKNNKIRDLMLEGIPYCLVDEEIYNFLEGGIKQLDKNVYFNNAFNGENDRDFSYKKIDKCKNCEFNNKCYGFSKDFLAYYKM